MVHNQCEVFSYKDRKKYSNIPGQAHHLSQDKAFLNVIPKDQGLTVKLQGNIRTDKTSPHYKAHKSLESFWDIYRFGSLKGQKPTIAEYNKALYNSLIAADMSKADAAYAVKMAYKQQYSYNLKNTDLVPRVPGKMWFIK